jgi:hypothetical protein
MKRLFAIAACAFALSGAALAGTRTYQTEAFDKVSVSAGIDVDISVGPARSVVAENKADDFDDLEISVKDNVLHIGRPGNSWFSFGKRTSYDVHVTTPALRSLVASSGADVTVKGSLEGDFSVNSSSGSDVDVTGVKGGNVKASASSGSDISIAGSCVSLDAHASSGSDVEADNLKCENVSVHASSGSDVSVAASKSVTGNASSGSDVTIRGRSPTVQVEKSSGADVEVGD